MKPGEIIENKNGFFLRRADEQDIQALLTLYFVIYGSTYPLSLGTDREVMRQILIAPDNLWLVAVDSKSQKICGSAAFEVDSFHKIARAEGLVVHPNHQRRGIATALLTLASGFLLEETRRVNSIYTTTRTLSLGPQLTFLKDGFIPLGFFPNAHRLASFETMTLMAKFHPEVLQKRSAINETPEALGPIIKCFKKVLKIKTPPPKLHKMVKPQPTGEKLEFDLIHAPSYVERKFFTTFTDIFDRFYPFHKPNFLASAKNGEIDIFGYLSEQDGYCTLVTATQPFYTMAGRMRPLMLQLRDFGISYVEILMQVENVLSLEAMLDVDFLPSAIYPAMLEYQGQLLDMVLMSRTLEPLNFRGIHFDKSFRPFVDQYIELWKKMHLDMLGVFDEKK